MKWCLRFCNADEIARGLSPLDPAAGAFRAGRLLLTELFVLPSDRVVAEVIGVTGLQTRQLRHGAALCA